MGNINNKTFSLQPITLAATINVGPGAIVDVDGVIYCIKRFETPESVLARNIETGLDHTIGLSQISHSSGTQATGPKVDLSAIPDEDWDMAIQRYQALLPLQDNPSRTALDVAKVAEEQLVSVATVYRWLDRLIKHGTVTCLLRKRRNDAGTKRLNSVVESIIKNVIATEFLTNQKRSPTIALQEIRRRCREAKVEAPCKSTLLSRINEILPEERERKRNGRNAALDYRAERGSMPGIDRLHSIWQIDHTRVDIMLVDERDRIPIGRPWITVAIDVFSRTVVGWYVSFDPPGALGTGICIANAILPKEALLAKLGVDLPWPCQGKPGIIQTDNAKEFRGVMLKNACNEHGFEMKFRKVKKPNYGAHIERLLGTLLQQIHSLDGTTFSNPQVRGEYDSEVKAAMTLDEFERWLANLILGPYHHNKHSSLGCAPIKRYRDGIFGDGETPGIGALPVAADPEKLRIDFLPLEERTIQPYGVVLDYIEYHDPVLDKWIGALDPRTKKLKRKFIFRRDPRNISYLIFWDPDVRQYYRIPYRDTSHPAISLWELRAVQRHLVELGKQDIDEDMIFKGLNEMRNIEENARELTRAQRLTQERRRRHGRVPPVSTPAINARVAEAEPSAIAESVSATPEPFTDFTGIVPFDEIEEM